MAGRRLFSPLFLPFREQWAYVLFHSAGDGGGRHGSDFYDEKDFIPGHAPQQFVVTCRYYIAGAFYFVTLLRAGHYDRSLFNFVDQLIFESYS